ncbi:MAG: hypothetical protein AVDCRST_MAG23-50 [uncultured Sphingosinicella sp.]|uniref:Lipoprotein n=1 Tax=uncultured Sphingosinicella sp. TaxID=478748 RepID=A0A6J4TC98_9SPHN|nr:hypothetical protein [uncultured Sphingosinicella sp.]CAA9518470.1 MAG: hypothetical protein AVDCRST_MAG23-50 [uncultured Sphingosinicella sp.]
MRKSLLPLVFGGALALGGCVYAGLAPAVVEAVRETGGQGRYAGEYLAPAAEEACRGRAARHGRVEITRVEPHNPGTMRVYGTIEDPYRVRDRSFSCLFRSDGNIGYFRLS